MRTFARRAQATDERRLKTGSAPVFRSIVPVKFAPPIETQAKANIQSLTDSGQHGCGDGRRDSVTARVEIPEALASGSIFSVKQHLQPTARFAFWCACCAALQYGVPRRAALQRVVRSCNTL